jgi:hypothetical protein
MIMDQRLHNSNDHLTGSNKSLNNTFNRNLNNHTRTRRIHLNLIIVSQNSKRRKLGWDDKNGPCNSKIEILKSARIDKWRIKLLYNSDRKYRRIKNIIILRRKKIIDHQHGGRLTVKKLFNLNSQLHLYSNNNHFKSPERWLAIRFKHLPTLLPELKICKESSKLFQLGLGGLKVYPLPAVLVLWKLLV